MGKNVNYYDLTNPQKSIWNTEEYFKGTTINNICAPEIIYERIDENILKKAINNVVEKNDNFRIQIHLEDDRPVQTITKFKPFDIDVEHIKDEEEIKKIEEEGINHKFDIINSCLYYFKIFILENGYGGFVVTVNHIIADSWSMGLLATSIIEEYHGVKNHEILPEKNTSYVNYINAEQEYKESKKYITDKIYWEEVFKTIPEQATIPSSHQIYKEYSSDGERKSFTINIKLVQKIGTFCKEHKISIFNFLMSVYSIYISRTCNLDDFVIGTPILNRANYAERQTMGMFVNMIPVRINIQEKMSFNEFTKTQSLQMMSLI